MKIFDILYLALFATFCISCGVKGRPLPPDNPYFVDKTEFKEKNETISPSQEGEKNTDASGSSSRKRNQAK
jgi:hypothetical protein